MCNLIEVANSLTWPGAITICVLALCGAAVAWRLIDKILG